MEKQFHCYVRAFSNKKHRPLLPVFWFWKYKSRWFGPKNLSFFCTICFCFLHSFRFFFSIIMRTRLPNCIIQASQLLELALLCLLIPWFEGHSWVFRGFHSIPVVWKLNEEKNSVTSFTFYMRLWILIKYSVYKDVFCLGDFIISPLMARFKVKIKTYLKSMLWSTG